MLDTLFSLPSRALSPVPLCHMYPVSLVVYIVPRTGVFTTCTGTRAKQRPTAIVSFAQSSSLFVCRCALRRRQLNICVKRVPKDGSARFGGRARTGATRN